MARILAVDDEVDVLNAVKEILEREGHSVSIESSSEAVLNLMGRERFDLIVLDIIMPELSGLELCQRIRADRFFNRIPILFLTARGHGDDIIQGLDVGGDDYLAKPFQIIELPARVRALLRRVPGGIMAQDMSHLEAGSLRLTTTEFEVEVQGKVVNLTAMEYRLLYYLMQRAGQPVTVDQLLQNIWEYPQGAGDPALVYQHIANLRAKIEPDPDQPRTIQNVPRRGYMVTA